MHLWHLPHPTRQWNLPEIHELYLHRYRLPPSNHKYRYSHRIKCLRIQHLLPETLQPRLQSKLQQTHPRYDSPFRPSNNRHSVVVRFTPKQCTNNRCITGNSRHRRTASLDRDMDCRYLVQIHLLIYSTSYYPYTYYSRYLLLIRYALLIIE